MDRCKEDSTRKGTPAEAPEYMAYKQVQGPQASCTAISLPFLLAKDRTERLLLTV